MPPAPRRSKGLANEERSPFSSPNSNLHASPIAARRSSLEERRRPAGKFEHVVSPKAPGRIEEEYEEEEEDEESEDLGEDDAGELSPLLPIFSAAQLGQRYSGFMA